MSRMSHPVTRIRWSFTSWAPTPWAFKALSVSSVAVRDYMRTHKVPSSGSQTMSTPASLLPVAAQIRSTSSWWTCDPFTMQVPT